MATEKKPKEAERRAAVNPERPDGLPEAGYTQREELKKRQDALMAELEFVSKQIEVGQIQSDKLDTSKIPREVRAAMDYANSEVYVSKADRNYRYIWVYRDPQNRWGARAVRALQASGWEVVMGDMDEAKEHAHGPSRERFVSDCLLMRCRLDIYARNQLWDREKRLRRHEGITATFQDIAAKHGVRVFDQNTMPDHIRGYMESQAGARRPTQRMRQRRDIQVPPARVMRREAAMSFARDRLVQQIKEGSVEGMTVEEAAARARR